MAKIKTGLTIGALALWAAVSAMAGAANPSKTAAPVVLKTAKAKPAAQPQAIPGNLDATGNLQGAAPRPELAPVPKPALAEAFIAENALRVFLNVPAGIYVYNSRGQQVAHLDSRRAMEAIPLQGINAGFVYLTVRTAQGEQTRKLIYTGR